MIRLVGVLSVALLMTACIQTVPEATAVPFSPTATPAPRATPQATSQATPEATPDSTPTPEPQFSMQTYPVTPGSRPHDVAPAADGGIWYTGQGNGTLGWLDPDSGEVREVNLGGSSEPHGVIVGPDGAPWITDGGLNAIVRVDPETHEIALYRFPASAGDARLNTAAFDRNGLLWFTGQNGFYGSLDPASGELRVFGSPRGRGPYGITATPDGDIYYSSLAGSYLGAVDIETGEVEEIDPPTSEAGLRRAWSDSRGRIWVSQWFAGQVGVYDPASGDWREWRLPGDAPQAYSVYIDETDAVWLTDFGANAIVRFDPETEEFRSFPLESEPANVRQQLGRPGEVWGAESAADQLVVIRWE
jgi:virginiamycin B lyase